jgi:colicin import membrane protein
MMLSPNARPLLSCLAAGVCSLLLEATGSAQEEALFVATSDVQEQAAVAAPEKAQKARALLDEIKKSEFDRQLALKQTEIDRIKQDQEKAERDAAGVQKTIESTEALIQDGGDELNKLAAETRRLEHELAVAEARIAAERLKIEGLRALSAAQSKSLSALARHAEECEARSRVRATELALLKEGKPIPPEGRDESAQGEIGKARKALAAAEAKTQAEERAAHEAVKAAAAKMALAEARAATAQRIAENDLTLPPVAEKAKLKSAEKPADKPSDKKESEPAVRKASASATAASTPKPTPKPVIGAARPANPARGPFFGR